MARIRTIKPEIALHEGLYDLEEETGLPIRFAWAVLPCHCDREGRFQWKPRRLGAQLLPYDGVDFSRVLDALLTRGFIVRYRVGHEWFGVIPTFTKHQVINNREKDSSIPDMDDADEVVTPENQQLNDACGTREPRVNNARTTPAKRKGKEGKGRERKGKENTSCSEPQSDSKPDAVFGMPLNDGSEHPITQQQVDEWVELFPAVDVMQALRSMKAWSLSNPTKRKTKSGVKRFITSWLTREQDKGGAGGAQRPVFKSRHERSQEAIEAFVNERTERVIEGEKL